MPDWPKLMILALLCSAPLVVAANQNASVTVSFSVYVEPAPEAPQRRAIKEERPCAEVLAPGESPETTGCRDDLLHYTWHERDRMTVLTIAPI